MLVTPLQQQTDTSTLRRPPQGLPAPFVFVPITGNEAAKGRRAAKRIVRQHVTRVQHAKSSTLNGTQDLQTWTVKPYIHSDQAVRRKPQAKQSEGKGKAKRCSSSDSDENKDAKPPPRELAMALIIPKLPSGTQQEDPFWTFPVDYKPYLAPIFAHCMLRRKGLLKI